MAAGLATIIAAATLAFGAVYPWGYVPLFVTAAGVGSWGILRQPSVLRKTRALGISLILVVAALSLQLVPLTRDRLDAVSPHASDILSRYSLPFAVNNSSHPVSIDPGETTSALLRLGALGLYLVGAPGALSGATVRRLPRNLILIGVPLALFGIVSREQGNGLVYWFWQPERGGGANAFGPFINRNHFAGWMLMATCLAIGFLLGQLERARGEARPSWRNRTLWLSSREASRLILTASGIGIMAISLVWTMSRSGILSFAVALACFFRLIALRWRVDRTRQVVAFACLGFVLVSGVGWRGPGLLLNWFGDTRDLKGRFAVWQDGWRVVEDFPLVGTGVNTYSTAMLFYQTTDSGLHVAQAHNDYLQLLAEGGLLVFPIAVTAVCCLIVAIRRSLRAAVHEGRGYWIRTGAAVGLIGIGVQETVEFSLRMPANAFLFCTLAAIALAPVNIPTERHDAGRQRENA